MYATQQPHVGSTPANMMQPQVHTTHSSSLVPINIAQFPGQGTIHIVDQSSAVLHLPMQSPVQTGLPTPPYSARQVPLQSSPSVFQTNQLPSVAAAVSNTSSHSTAPMRYNSLEMQGLEQSVMAQRQSAATGPGQPILSTAIPRRSMPATQPTVGGTGQPNHSHTTAGNTVGSYNPHYPLNATAVARQNEHYHQNAAQPYPSQFANGPPQNYHQSSTVRRHSYNHAQLRSTLPNDTIPFSSSAPFPTHHRTTSHPAISIPGSQPVGPSSATIHATPMTPEALRHSQTATSSTASSRPGSVSHPFSTPNSLPQSPVLHVSQDSQMRSAYSSYPQPQPRPQSQPSLRPIQPAPSQPHQASSYSQAQYASQQRTAHQPHQMPLQTQVAPQARQQVQQAPQAQPQAQQAQPQQPQPQTQPPAPTTALAMPSRAATTHAQSLLTGTTSYLEYAYRAAVFGVARELDRQNGEFTTLRETNKRLAELNKQAEEERVFLRQERTRLLEEVAKLQREKQAAPQTQSLPGDQATQAELERLREENKRIRKLNNVVLHAAYGSTALGKQLDVQGADVDPNEIALVRIGSLVAPRGLVKAIEESIKEPIVQHYEGQLAQVMTAARREREMMSRQQSLLQELVKSAGEVAAAPPPSTVAILPNALIPTQPQPESPANRPSSVPAPLPPSLSRRRTPEQARAASQHPSSSSVRIEDLNIQSIPTPPRTATPLGPTDTHDEPIIKMEPTEVSTWPWSKGEIIDLTLPDSPPPPPPASFELEEVNADALRAELDEHMKTIESSLEDDIPEAEQHPEQEIEMERETEKEKGEGTCSPARKRSLDDDTGQDMNGARKKMRVEGVDVEMDEGEVQPPLPMEEGEVHPSPPRMEEGELQSASQETVIPAHGSAPDSAQHEPPLSRIDAPGAETVEQPPQAMVVDTSTVLHQSPEPMHSVPAPPTQPIPVASTLPPPVQYARPPSAIPTSHDLGPLPGPSTFVPPSIHQAPPAIKAERTEPLLSPQTTPSKPKLGIRHMDLAYHTSKTEMTCRMCFKRKEITPHWEIVTFPLSAPWAELARHCEEVHPAGYRNLVNLDPAMLAETRERMLNKDGHKARR